MHALLQTTNLRQMGIGQETYPCEGDSPPTTASNPRNHLRRQARLFHELREERGGDFVILIARVG